MTDDVLLLIRVRCVCVCVCTTRSICGSWFFFWIFLGFMRGVVHVVYAWCMHGGAWHARGACAVCMASVISL